MTRFLGGIEVAIHSAAQVGEGPTLDPRTGQLIWVDLTEGKLIESDLTSGQSRETSVGRTLGAAVARAHEPGFAVAVAEGFGYVVDGRFSLVDTALHSPQFRMNDAKCDARGRLWAGSTQVDFEEARGVLHRWDGSSPSSKVASGFTLPNGLGWDGGNTVMYVNDSVRRVTLRAAFDLDAGTVAPFETGFAIAGGLPDGLAVDVDGCVWIAVWGGAEVRRYNPEGVIDTIVPIPVSQPSSCCFGSGGILYITTAAAGTAAEPLAGSVFAIQTHTEGVEIASFAA